MPPTPSQADLSATILAVREAQAQGLEVIGGVRTDFLAWLLEQAEMLETERRRAAGAVQQTENTLSNRLDHSIPISIGVIDTRLRPDGKLP